MPIHKPVIIGSYEELCSLLFPQEKFPQSQKKSFIKKH